MSLATRVIKMVLAKAGYEIRPSQFSPMRKLLGASDRPIETILDVGANEGQFARWISSYFPRVEIYCFEPVPEAFSRLATWARTQNGRVTPVQCAIGDVKGSFKLIKHDNHTSSSSFLKTTVRCEEYYPETKAKSIINVNCETLDAAVARLPKPLQREILIKLDVQGYEAHVIRGARETFLDASVAILEVSLVPLYESQPNFAEIVRLMDELNFDYVGSLEQICNADGRLLSIDAVFFSRA